MKKESKIIKNSLPLVSVIMPVYNASNYLVAALDSIIRQSYTNWELIAVDDASSDDSYLILSQYSKLDSRIKVFKNVENLGVSKTANYAISKAKGTYLMRMDADDISYSKRMEKQLKFLLKNPKNVIVGGQVKIINKEGRFIKNKNFPLNHKNIYEMMYTAMSLQQGAMMINKSLLPKNFEWYNGVRTAEEVKLFFKLFNYGTFANISDYVLGYRNYGTSTSLKNAKQTFKITYKTRKIALKEYAYKATFKSKIINEVQNIVVSILPNKLIYPVFLIVRNIVLFGDVINNSKKLKTLKKNIKNVEVFATTLL